MRRAGEVFRFYPAFFLCFLRVQPAFFALFLSLFVSQKFLKYFLHKILDKLPGVNYNIGSL